MAQGSSARNTGASLAVAGLAAEGDSTRVVVCVVVCVIVIVSETIEAPDGDPGDNDRVTERVDVCVVVCIVVAVSVEAGNRCS